MTMKSRGSKQFLSLEIGLEMKNMTENAEVLRRCKDICREVMDSYIMDHTKKKFVNNG